MKNKQTSQNNEAFPPAMHFFMSISDPRIDRGKAHPLSAILMVAICGVISGAESFVDMEDFGNAKKEWLSSFLDLSNGIPSHDTFGRVFSLIDPRQFQESFALWMGSCVELSGGKVIAIDGKTNRRTGGTTKSGDKIKPLHLVSAFATANGVALGQVATNQKSNEITAIPELLKLLDIAGCLITTDAMGCQSDIAADIVTRGGDYLLAVKGNQGLLYRDIKACFARLSDQEGSVVDPQLHTLLEAHTTEGSNHGRLEKRVCDVLSGEYVINQLRHKNNWVELNNIVRVTATRTSKKTGEVTKATRYYICSLKNPSAERIQRSVREHWGVENGLHWTLDMAMREDESRIRTDHAPANMAVLRHIALNLVRMDKTRKVGIKASLKKAGWDTKYLEKLLGIALSVI
jgi:predicted transposase YbfD/YdcC